MKDKQRQVLQAVARSATPADLSILQAALDSMKGTSDEQLVLSKQRAGHYRVIRYALVYTTSLLLLYACSPVFAQKSAEQLRADAHEAGMFQAFRICLKQEKADGQISAEEHQRCDQTAERLYFGLYNTDYAGPHSPISKKFVDDAQKVVNAVAGHPGLCHADADFKKVGAAVIRDVKGFYPDHPDVSCGIVPPCECEAPNVTADTGELTPKKPLWNGLFLAIPGIVKVYTDYCLGTTMDGIVFLPQNVNAAPLQCDAKNVHIRQFIYTTCVYGYDCGPSKPTTCGSMREFNAWYLDECSEFPFLIPDSSTKADWKGPREINDEPTPNMVNLADQPPVVETFHDVIMCGSDQVLGALSWKRTGVLPPPKPLWCSMDNGTLKVKKGAPYSDLHAEDPKSDDVRTAVCAALKSQASVKDLGLQRIVANFGGCPNN